MTEGIDVASPQAGISFKRVAAAGIKFVMIKCGGAQIPGAPYVAPHYLEQVTAARPVFRNAIAHYWLTGAAASVEAQADYFAAHLHDFRSRDGLMLDNEPLDGAPKVFTPTEVTAFFRRLHAKTGADYTRMWLYTGDAAYLAHDWAEVRGLGVQLVRARYGSDDGTRHTLPASSWGYSVHQYTSRGRVAGFTLDRDYSPRSVADLFPANRKRPATTPPPAKTASVGKGQQVVPEAVPPKITPAAAVPTPAKASPTPVPAAPAKPTAPAAPDVTAVLAEVLAHEGDVVIYTEAGTSNHWLLDGTKRTALDPAQLTVYKAGGARIVTVPAGSLREFATT